MYDAEVFFTALNAAGNAGRILRAVDGEYMKDAQAVSPWNHFGLADDKILSSLVVSTEDLPADWTVHVDYAINGDDSTWTNVISYTTDNGNGTKTQVSTDSSTITFRTLSVRVRFEYTGAGVPTTQPRVLAVDALAMVAKQQKIYALTLDLSDDKSGGQGHSGARKRTNIEAAAATEAVIDFKDGYPDRTPGVYDQLDVVIDSYQIVSSTPGEGVAQVVLKETV